MSLVQMPKGTLETPLTISEAHSAVTFSANTANVETDVYTIRCPRKAAWAFKALDMMYLSLKTAGATALAGTSSVKVYLADANKVTKLAIVDSTPLSAFAELTDETKKFRFKAGFARGEDEYIIVAVKAATVSASANSALLITGTQVIEQ